MDNHELTPELKKLLESLQEVPERDLQASHVSREKYLTQVRNLKPRRRARRKASRQQAPNGRRGWVTRLATLAVVIVVALSSLGGTLYAAQAAQPDDLLYGVKTLTEQIQVRLEENPEEKLDLYVSFANRRVQEIQNQLAAGEEVSQKAMSLLEQHTQQMMQQAAQLNEFAMNKALRQIEENLQLQNQIMAELGKERPQDGPPGVLAAQEKIRERLEIVEDGLNEPEGFRERMQHETATGQEDGKEPGSPEPQGDPEGGQKGTEAPGNGEGNGQGK